MEDDDARDFEIENDEGEDEDLIEDEAETLKEEVESEEEQVDVEEEAEEAEDEEEETEEVKEEVEEGKIDPNYPQPIRTRNVNFLKQHNTTRKIIIVPDIDRITTNVIQKYELAKILGMRAKQIAKNPVNIFVEIDANDINPVEIAKKELKLHRCPFLLRREVGVTDKGELICEQFDVNEMALPADFKLE